MLTMRQLQGAGAFDYFFLQFTRSASHCPRFHASYLESLHRRQNGSDGGGNSQFEAKKLNWRHGTKNHQRKMRFARKTSQVKRHFTHSKMVPNGPKNVCSSVIQASQRCSGQMVSELDSGSSGLGSSADQGIALCSWSLYSRSDSLQPANC